MRGTSLLLQNWRAAVTIAGVTALTATALYFVAQDANQGTATLPPNTDPLLYNDFFKRADELSDGDLAIDQFAGGTVMSAGACNPQQLGDTQKCPPLKPDYFAHMGGKLLHLLHDGGETCLRDPKTGAPVTPAVLKDLITSHKSYSIDSVDCQVSLSKQQGLSQIISLSVVIRNLGGTIHYAGIYDRPPRQGLAGREKNSGVADYDLLGSAQAVVDVKARVVGNQVTLGDPTIQFRTFKARLQSPINNSTDHAVTAYSVDPSSGKAGPMPKFETSEGKKNTYINATVSINEATKSSNNGGIGVVFGYAPQPDPSYHRVQFMKHMAVGLTGLSFCQQAQQCISQTENKIDFIGDRLRQDQSISGTYEEHAFSQSGFKGYGGANVQAGQIFWSPLANQPLTAFQNEQRSWNHKQNDKTNNWDYKGQTSLEIQAQPLQNLVKSLKTIADKEWTLNGLGQVAQQPAENENNGFGGGAGGQNNAPASSESAKVVNFRQLTVESTGEDEKVIHTEFDPQGYGQRVYPGGKGFEGHWVVDPADPSDDTMTIVNATDPVRDEKGQVVSKMDPFDTVDDKYLDITGEGSKDNGIDEFALIDNVDDPDNIGDPDYSEVIGMYAKDFAQLFPQQVAIVYDDATLRNAVGADKSFTFDVIAQIQRVAHELQQRGVTVTVKNDVNTPEKLVSYLRQLPPTSREETVKKVTPRPAVYYIGPHTSNALIFNSGEVPFGFFDFGGGLHTKQLRFDVFWQGPKECGQAISPLSQELGTPFETLNSQETRDHKKGLGLGRDLYTDTVNSLDDGFARLMSCGERSMVDYDADNEALNSFLKD